MSEYSLSSVNNFKRNKEKKLILLDLLNAQPAKGSKYHGGGEYIKSVFHQLLQIENEDAIQVTVAFDPDRFLDEWVLELILNHNISSFHVKSEKDIGEISSKVVPDVFFSGLPYRYKREWFNAKTKLIGTIHGLRALEKPFDEYDYLYSDNADSVIMSIKRIKWSIDRRFFNKDIKEYNHQKSVFQNTINFLDKIVCVSNHTKYSLLSNYSIEPSEIEVMYSPAKVVVTRKKEEKCPIEGDYILIIGGDRWLKNSYRALIAIDQLISSGKLSDCRVVVVGNLSQAIKRRLHNLNYLVCFDYVEPLLLESLYKNCRVFVYPSLNEGFGYPPLEAMAYGKTCVVSAVSSLTEVCGDAVYYINPYDVIEIKTRVLCAYYNKIDEKHVLSQYRKIRKKQDDDLNSLAEMILNS